MSYKNLIHFRNIIKRGDFNYISSHQKIDEISSIILSLHESNDKEKEYIAKLKEFSDNLRSFYISIGEIPDIKRGFVFSQTEIGRTIRLLEEPAANRAMIARPYLRKCNKLFLYGLSKLYDGLQEAFNPSVTQSTNINRDQLVMYILDKREGLGRRFLFNTHGRHAIANKLPSLTRGELIATERLLLRPGKQKRDWHGWGDLGLGHAPVRILIDSRLGRDRVFFLFRLSEHKDYVNQLKVAPEHTAFSAA